MRLNRDDLLSILIALNSKFFDSHKNFIVSIEELIGSEYKPILEKIGLKNAISIDVVASHLESLFSGVSVRSTKDPFDDIRGCSYIPPFEHYWDNYIKNALEANEANFQN